MNKTKTSDGLQPNSDGLQPNSDGLQPNSDGLRPNSDALQPNSDGLQPNSDGLQPNSKMISMTPLWLLLLHPDLCTAGNLQMHKEPKEQGAAAETHRCAGARCAVDGATLR